MKLQLVKSNKTYVNAELDIYNSNPQYNVMAKGKATLESTDIQEEIEDSLEIGAERFLIHNGKDYIGILDYLMKNPSDGTTWLGLLMIKKEFQHQSLGHQTLEIFYEIMRSRNIKQFRIGVFVENESAHEFWRKQGFIAIKTTNDIEGKEIIVYEKNFL